jgi:hypothetical protein
VELADLGVGDDADNLASRADLGELLLDALLAGAVVLGDVLGEGLLLALVPVLVEAALAGLVEVLSPDGGDGAETIGGLGVTDDTDDDHGRGLDDGDGLDGLLLVETRARAGDVAEDVGHAGLVANEGGELARLGLVIVGEVPHATTVVPGPLAGQEAEGTVPGGGVLTVRPARKAKENK